MSHNKCCYEDLECFYGIPPYEDHVSRSSMVFYDWIVIKYGKETVSKCEKALTEEYFQNTGKILSGGGV